MIDNGSQVNTLDLDISIIDKIQVPTKIKSVTPTESANRPVKQFPVETEPKTQEKPVSEIADRKPKPKFVSESDQREELTFQLGIYK